MTALWCLAADRCRGFACGEPEQATRTPLCESCLNSAPRDIQALPYDYRDLEQLLPVALGVWPDPTTGYVKVKVTEAPIPIREYIEALQRRIWALVVTWEQVVRERDRLADVPLRGVRDGFAVSRAVRILTPRLELLASVGPVQVQDYPLVDENEATVFGRFVYEQVTGARAVLDLVATHAVARSVLGLTAPVRRLPGVCDRCRCPDLRQDQPREAGDEQPVYCGSCTMRMTYDDYAQRYNVLRRAA